MAAVSGSEEVPKSWGRFAFDVVTAPVWVPYYGLRYGCSAAASLWDAGKANHELRQAANTPSAPQELRAIVEYLKRPTDTLSTHQETLRTALRLLNEQHPWFSLLTSAERQDLQRLLEAHEQELVTRPDGQAHHLPISAPQEKLIARLEHMLAQHSSEEHLCRVLNRVVPGAGTKLKAVNTLAEMVGDVGAAVKQMRDAHDTPSPPKELQGILEFLKTAAIPSAEATTLTTYLDQLKTCKLLFEREDPWFQKLSPAEQATLRGLIHTQIGEATEALHDSEPASSTDNTSEIFQDCESECAQELRDFLTRTFSDYSPFGQMKRAGFSQVERACPGLLPYNPFDARPEVGNGGISTMMGATAPMLGDFMKTIGNFALQSASETGKKILASWLLAAFEATVATVPTNEENPETLTQWRTCLKDLQEGKGSWTSLKQLIDAGKVRCWGLRIPFLPEATQPVAASTGALCNYRDQSRTLGKLVADDQAIYATPLPTQADPLRRTQQGFERDQKACVDNTTHLLTFKWLSELFLPPSQDSDYLTTVKSAIHRADDTTSASQILKENLLQKIRDTRIAWSVSWISGWCKEIFAKMLWWLYETSIHYLLEKVTKHHAEQVFAFIDNENREGFKGFRAEMIDRLNAYFNLLAKVYAKAAAENPPGLRTYEQDIDELIKSMNTDLDGLYAKFFDLELKVVVPDNWIARVGLWIFQTLFHWLHGGEKEILQSLSRLGVSSLSDANGYKHPLNTLLLDFLKGLRREMENPAPDSSASMEVSQLKEPERQQLAILSKHLFNVLPKQACESKDELQHTYNPPSLLDRVNETWIVPPVVEKATVVFSKVLDAVANKEWLTNIVYDSAHLASQIYEPSLPTAVSAEQTAKELTDTTTALLTLAIKQTVDEILNSSQRAKEENRQVNQLIATLKGKTLSFVGDMQRQVDRLRDSPQLGVTLAARAQEYITWAANAKSNYEADPFLKGSEPQLNQKFASSSAIRATLIAAIQQLTEPETKRKDSDKKLRLLTSVSDRAQTLLRELEKENPDFSTIGVLVQESVRSGITVPETLQPEQVRASLQVISDAKVLISLFARTDFKKDWPSRAVHVIGHAVADSTQASRLTALVTAKATEEPEGLRTSTQTSLETIKRSLSKELNELQRKCIEQSGQIREQQATEAQGVNKPTLLTQIEESLEALLKWAESEHLKAEPLINIEPVQMRVIHEYLRGFLHAQLEPIAKQVRTFISSDSFFEHGLIEAVGLRSYVGSYQKV